MIALQRHREILNRVAKHGSARVHDLAHALSVTEETIRRDLRALDRQGKLTRTHGGAVARLSNDDRIDLPYDKRHASHPAEKRALAEAALKLIQPGQVIALDASSTACHLAQQLPDQPLTVVTNSLLVCSVLAAHEHVDVVCTGGMLDADAMAFYGLHAQRTLERINIEQCFFSCRGIDLDRGLSEANDRHAEIKSRMLDGARQRILMADGSKLGVASTLFFAPAEAADRILLTLPTSDHGHNAITQLQQRGIAIDPVIVAD